MKKILTLSSLALLALTLTGCEKDESWRAKVDGHAYIVIETNRGVAMVHDPDCPCCEHYITVEPWNRY